MRITNCSFTVKVLLLLVSSYVSLFCFYIKQYVYIYMYAITYSQFLDLDFLFTFLRLRNFFSNDYTSMRCSDKMSEFLSQSGFPVDTIKNSLRKASKFPQSEAIIRRKYVNNTRIPLTMKFSGITQCIAKTIKKTPKHHICQPQDQSYYRYQLHSCGI